MIFKLKVRKRYVTNININVLNTVGDILYANKEYGEAALVYDECINYSKNPKELIKAGITYYNLSLKTKSNKISYLKRARDLLEKAIYLTNDVDANYYYALTLIELGEIKKAIDDLSLIVNSIEDKVVASTIESYVFLNQLSFEEDKEAYQYIDDPFLISLYDFIKTKLPNELFNNLKRKYKSNNKYVNLVKELKELYSKFVINPKMKKVLRSPIERYILLIYVLLRGEKNKDIVEIIKNKDFKKIPPYTRNIIKVFVDYMGFKQNEELPYFIQKDIETAEKITDIIEKNELKPNELLTQLKRIKVNLSDEKIVKKCNKLINELKYGVPSSEEIVLKLRKILVEHLKNTYFRITAFYNQKSALSLFKSILSSLKVSDKIKMDILSKI